MVFLDELVMSSGKEESLRQSVKELNSTRIYANLFVRFFVIIIFESKTRSVEWALIISETNNGVVGNQLKFWSGSD